MNNRLISIALAMLALAGCNREAPAPAPEKPAAPAQVAVQGPERHIVAFGDSLFAGYGLPQAESYPAQLEVALRARGINARVTNAGVSGDTTAAGRQRLAFVLDAQAQAPALVILELGGNDVLRGLPPAETRANLVAMMDELKRRKIPVLLMGMLAPPNLGAEHRQAFDAIYPALAQQYDAALVPFFLAPVLEKPALLQADRIHPNAAGVGALVTATGDAVAKALPATQ